MQNASSSPRAADPLVGVLTEIARIVAETLSLPDVFARVAEAARRVLPFDAAGVVRIVDGPALLSWGMATPGHPGGPEWRYERSEISDLLWPSATGTRRIDDARAVLDPSLRADRDALDSGTRSILVAPIVRGLVPLGSLWLSREGAVAVLGPGTRRPRARSPTSSPRPSSTSASPTRSGRGSGGIASSRRSAPPSRAPSTSARSSTRSRRSPGASSLTTR